MIHLLQVFVYNKQYFCVFSVYNHREVCYNTFTKFEQRYDESKSPEDRLIIRLIHTVKVTNKS